MKDFDKNTLDFIIQHYDEGGLDTERALRQFEQRAGIAPRRSWRHIAAVAALVMVVGGALACGLWYSRQDQAESQVESIVPDTSYRILKQKDDSSILLQYDNEPIGNVLRELSTYYKKELYTKENRQRISGEIEASSLEEIIVILETTLNIKIQVK